MRFLFLSLFTMFLGMAQGQEKPFETILGWRGGGSSNPIYVKSISDSSKNLTCVLAKNSSEMRGFLFDKQMHFLKEFKTTASAESLVGGFIKDSVAHVFLKDEYTDAVHAINIRLADGSPQEFLIPYNPKGEKELGKLSTGTSFLYLTASKKEPIINVYKFTGTDVYDKIAFDLSKDDLKSGFEKKELWEALSTASGLSRSVDVAIVDPDVETEADVADSPNKVYLRNNQLILLLDKNPEKLKIFELDLLNKTAVFRGIKRDFNPLPPDGFNLPRFNSFMLDNKLYFVHATSAGLNVSLYDFNSGEILSKYYADADSTITFKNTPVVQEGGGTIYSKNTERELVKTKQLLRKMTAGNALITAVRNQSGLHEVTVGAYKKITQAGGGYMMGGAGGMYGGGAPVFVMHGSGASWSRVTRFKMLVDPSSGKQVQGQMDKSPGEQIQEYSKDLRIPEDGSSVFVANSFSQFAYYDRDEKKIDCCEILDTRAVKSWVNLNLDKYNFYPGTATTHPLKKTKTIIQFQMPPGFVFLPLLKIKHDESD